jgi:hypothetical protein
MRVVAVLAFVALACATPSYVYPDVYQTRTDGYVNDAFLGFQNVGNLGFMYVDYTRGAIRVDEMWNVSGLFLSKALLMSYMGVSLSDTHLFDGKNSYLFWTNASGIFCVPTASPLLPQDMFSADTFVGNITHHNREAYVFTVSTSQTRRPPALPHTETIHSALTFRLCSLLWPAQTSR